MKDNRFYNYYKNVICYGGKCNKLHSLQSKSLVSVFARVLCVLLVVILFITPLSASAQVMDNGNDVPELVNYTGTFSWPSAPSISAEGAYLIDCDTGAVIYGKNQNQQFYPASITKVLTALIVCEKVSDLSEEVTFSYNAINNLEEGGYSYIAREGDKLPVYDCLCGLLMNSSNECAVALAEYVSGSVEEFAKLMNEKASELGCTNSNFVNPNGLTNTEHKTTPHDMALILRAAVNNDKFLEIDKKVTYTTAPTTSNPEGYNCLTSHKMKRDDTEYYDSRVVCGKTGYLTIAGNTLVTYASSGDLNLVCVVMKENGASIAYEDTESLISYAFKYFEHLEATDVVNYEELYNEVAELSSTNVGKITYDDTLYLTVPNGSDASDITYEISYNDGDESGMIIYKTGGNKLEEKSFEVIYNTGLFTAIKSVTTNKDGSSNVLAIIIIVVLVIIAFGVVIKIIFRNKNKKLFKDRRHGSSRRQKK